MPAYSTLDLINEVYIAIQSIRNSCFTLDELVQKINENREKKGEKRKVSSDSVNRILEKLWLPLGIRRNPYGVWERGTGPIRGMTNLRPDIVERILREQRINATPIEIDRWISLAEEPTTRKAYICYPYHDNPIRRSMELLILLIHLYPKAKDKFVPATPHEMYWGLEEKTDRETAMNECEKLIERCDCLLYCLRKDDEPSSGMKRDINVARKKGKNILYIEDILGYYPNVENIMVRCGLAEFTTVSPKAKATQS